MKDGDVAGARTGICERPHILAQVIIHRQRVEIRLVPFLAEERAHAAGAVADGIAPVGGRHPLVDDHAPSSPAPGGPPPLSSLPRPACGEGVGGWG